MKKFRFLSFILCLMLLFCGCDTKIPQSTAVDYNNTVTMVDVGQAACTLIESDGQFCLIDAGKYGGSNDIVAYLSQRNVEKIDLFVLTHFHHDHTSHAMDVIRNFDIGTVLIPALSAENTPDTYFYKSLLADADNGYYNLAYAHKGWQLDVGSGTLSVVDDTYNSENINNTSTVTVFTLGDFTYVNMADTETDRDYYLLDLLPENIDFLTAGHHGSKDATSEQLLDKLNPHFAGISCGRDNDYGHPHKGMLSRLEERNIPYETTAEKGNIVYYINTYSINFE